MAAYLGIDPSLTATGWILVDGDRIDFGCIRTKPEQKKRHTFKSDDTTRRLELILRGLWDAQATTKLGSVRLDIEFACEQPAGARSAAAASALSEVHGALVGWFFALGMLDRVRWVPARDGKLALGGEVSACKAEMMDQARRWLSKRTAPCGELKYEIAYDDLTKVEQEAVADALGVLLASKLMKEGA